MVRGQADGDRIYETIPSRIAFGSCNKPYRAQPLWSALAAVEPEVWAWTGDAVYTNDSTIPALEAAFESQLSNTNYTQFLEATRARVLGAVDDHDYGVNDGGRDVLHRARRIELYRDFIRRSNVHSDEQRWPPPPGEDGALPPRDGLYSAHEFGGRVKLILLDTRTHRGAAALALPGWLTRLNIPVIKSFYGKINTVLRTLSVGWLAWARGGQDLAHRDMLGAEQWRWLDDQLRDSRADFHIVVSSVQVLTTNPFVESWMHYPAELRRLMSLFDESRARGLVLLSGDVHFAELTGEGGNMEQDSKDARPTPRRTLEVTSSGMTHGTTSNRLLRAVARRVLRAYGRHRSAKDAYFADGFNFGTVEFLWEGLPADVAREPDSGGVVAECEGGPVMRVAVRDVKGTAVLTALRCSYTAPGSRIEWVRALESRTVRVGAAWFALALGCVAAAVTAAVVAVEVVTGAVRLAVLRPPRTKSALSRFAWAMPVTSFLTALCGRCLLACARCGHRA